MPSSFSRFRAMLPIYADDLGCVCPKSYGSATEPLSVSTRARVLKGISSTPENCVSPCLKIPLCSWESCSLLSQAPLSPPGTWGLAVVANPELCQLRLRAGGGPNGSSQRTRGPGIFNIPELPVLVFFRLLKIP